MRNLEREINLYDLFCYILQKWRVILFSTIIFVVVMAGIGTLNNINIRKHNLDQDNNIIFENLSLLDQSRINQYYLTQSIYEDILKNNQQDRILSINVGETYKNILYFIISNNKNGINIANLFKQTINYEWQKIGGINLFNEFTIFNDSSVNIYTNADNKLNENELITLSIVIYGEDKLDCQKNLENTVNIINNLQEEIYIIFGEYKLDIINKGANQVRCSNLIDYITRKKNEEYSALYNKTNIITTLSDTAKNYINQQEFSQNNDITNELKKDDIRLSGLINIKYLILGLVLGILIPSGIYSIKYILNANLCYEDDVEKDYEIELLGRVSEKYQKNTIDNIISNLRRRKLLNLPSEEIVSVIASEIKIKARKKYINKIYCTGTVFGELERNLVNKIRNYLDDSGIELICGKSILLNSEGLEESAEIGNIILIEKSGESYRHNIENEIIKTKARGLDIFGLIVVE